MRRGLARAPQLRWLRSRLFVRLLRLTLPGVAVISILAVVVLVGLRTGELQAAQRQRYVETVERAAASLSHPIWNLDRAEIDAQLAVLTSVPGIRCARLRGADYIEPVDAGADCQNLGASERFERPLQWRSRGGVVTLGRLGVWADSGVDRAMVWSTLWPLLVLLIVLLAALGISATIAFSRSVLNPLARVGASLRAYRNSGERAAVDWHSNDELGAFIGDYNAVLLAQEQAERSLRQFGEVGKELTATLNPEQVFDRVYRQLNASLDAHVFAIAIFDGYQGLVKMDYLIEGGERQPGLIFPLTESNRPAVWCVRENSELITARQDELLNYVEKLPPVPQGEMMESIIYLPLCLELRVIGCLSVQSPRVDAYSDEQIAFLRVIASYTAIALANAMAHQSLIEAQSSLVTQEKMAALGTLTAGVAHEINNPTNFIAGAAQNLAVQMQQFREFLGKLAGEDAEPEVLASIDAAMRPQHEQLETILDGSLRITRIVADLRQFTRLDEAARKAIRLSEPIRATFNLIRTRFDRIAFELDLGFDPPIECQPAKLGQVFMNLLANACEAVQAYRGIQGGWVRVATAIDGDRVVVIIEDNGGGMDDAIRQRVFEPFFTTKSVGEGTGLGLAITLGIVNEHGGSIAVDSVPGAGSRFSVWLPLARPNGSSG